jgi:surfeit locus 1 family protein
MIRASMPDSPPDPTQYTARRQPGREGLLVRIAPTLVVLLVTPLLIGLGLWQLDRARQKRELIAAFEQGGGEVLTLEEALARGPDAALYRRIELEGRYLARRQFLLDGQIEDGRAGYDVLTPLVLDGEDGTILVNRGFVPQGPAREPLGDIAVDEGKRRVTGRIAELPRAGLKLGPAGEGAGERWPRVMLYPERAELEAALGEPVLEPIVLLDAEAPDGYVRNWQVVTDLPPARHVAYALQWFAFAATLVVIYVVLLVRRRARR